MKTIEINVYKSGGVWFGARFIGGEYDGCDELGCEDDCTDNEALAVARKMPLMAVGERTVRRVDDVG